MEYSRTPANDRINKFTAAYRADAPLLLHRALADIVVDAAISLYHDHGYRLRVYDGLRSMEAGFVLYRAADPAWLAAGLLAAPGNSAHNRALAVDSSLVDSDGCEVERFDNLDMNINHRDYTGDAITPQQRSARHIKERAFQRAAMLHGTLIAPLISEYWDDRMPGSEADLWRIMASLRRLLHLTVQEAPDRATDYHSFATQWQALPQQALHDLLGSTTCPPAEAMMYHEAMNPIYDGDLPAPLKQVNPAMFELYTQSR